MENRKLVSWRLEKLDKKQQDTINAWLNAQQNIQLSLTNVVQHMIDRHGITDIMNYDVQKSLYTNPDAIAVEKTVKSEVQISEEKETISPKSEQNVQVASKDNNDDDLYDELNNVL